MDIVSGVVVYILLWWLVFFMALPVGVRVPSGDELAPGHATSAPIRPNLWRKAMASTVIAAGLWLVVHLVIDGDFYSFRQAVSDW
jgi:predicted secreted protein